MRMIYSVLMLVILSSGAYAQTTTELLPIEQRTISIFEKTSPLVVNVHELRTFVDTSFHLRDIQAGMASGFLWNREGYVVTNFHVIAHANKIAVTLQKGRTVPARVIGGLPRKDIAVLKIDDKEAIKGLANFEQIPLADSSKLKVGQMAIAIGNPFGLDRTLTTGIVSALGREIPGFSGNIQNMVQTDASINPGNSGGPLLDSSGRLIGMNTLIFSRSGASAGIGFAVPANDIKRIVTQIIKYGHVRQAAIGVHVFSDQVAHYLGIKGIVIVDVLKNSPAEKAGLRGTMRDVNGRIRIGDIILGINGTPVNKYEDFNKVLDKVKIGDDIELSYERDGKENTIKIGTYEGH